MDQSQAEAYNRTHPNTLQLRPFNLTIHHTPSNLETALYGAKPSKHNITVWGFTELDAMKRWEAR